MKRLRMNLARWATALLASGCGTAILDPVVAPAEDGALEAHWTFDEGTGTTAHDDSPQRHDGTLVNGGTWVPAGRFGGALSLQRDQHVEVKDFPAATTSWTVSLWARFASGDFTVGHRAPLIGTELNGGGWEINAPDDNTPANFEFSFPVPDSNNNNGHIHAICCTPRLDEWMHITASFDGSTKTLSIQGGSEMNTNTAKSLITPGNKTLFIGSASGQSEQFQGTVDEIRIYKRVLSQAEITALNSSP